MLILIEGGVVSVRRPPVATVPVSAADVTFIADRRSRLIAAKRQAHDNSPPLVAPR